MNKEQPDYLSYLLRLRRMGGQEAAWRASLEDPHTGDLHRFASLEEAVGFVKGQMGLASQSAAGRARDPNRPVP